MGRYSGESYFRQTTRVSFFSTVHHIVSDGWSVGIITDEMGQIYESLAKGEAPSLAPLHIQYGDYACWQEDWIASGELDRQLEDLKGRLDQFPPLIVPTDLERHAPPSGKGKICSILLPRELTNSLQQFSERQGCTMFVTMLSAFAILMQSESHQQELTIRTQTAGRSRVELEGLIGWFVNSIILRLGVSGDPAFADLVKGVGETVMEAFDYQHIPFERLVEIISPKKAPPRHPLFQVNFIFQRDFVRPWERGGITMTPIPSKATGTFVDLNFFLVEREDGWRASVDVNTDVFRPETGEFLLRNYQKILEAVNRDSQVRISGILLPPRPLPAARERSVPELPPQPQNGPSTTGEIEADLLGWLSEALGVVGLGASDDFFDLGGNSLLAIRLFAKIRQTYGLDLGLATLFRARTMRALASIVRDGGAGSSHSSIVTIKTEGSKLPLYVIHGVGGNVLGFNDLARCLDRPVYGIQSQALDDSAPVLTRVEEIAAYYVREIRELQPEGPYCLLGFSFGGLVAYEMALQLRAQGAKVGLVGLIDAEQPGVIKDQTFAQRTMRLLKQAKIDLKTVVFGPRRLAHLGGRLHARALRIAYTLLAAVGRPVPQSLRSAYDINWFARVNYTPGVYTGNVLLLRAKDELAHTTNEHDLGWSRVAAGGTEVVEIPGNHIEMFEDENVRIVAAHIERCIEDAVQGMSN